jgi:hypothetical protein
MRSTKLHLTTEPPISCRCCVCPEWTSYPFQSPKLSRNILFSKRRSEVLSKRVASSSVQVPVMPTQAGIFRSKVYHLIQLGVEQGLAYAWSRTRKGGWAIAQSPILGTTITLMALNRRGYELSARLLLGNHPYFMNRRICARDEMPQRTFYRRAGA